VGLTSGLLGASRARKEDAVAPDAGIELLRVAGDPVRAGEPLCLLHARDPGRIPEAARLLEGAFEVGEEPPPARRMVLEEIEADALGKD